MCYVVITVHTVLTCIKAQCLYVSVMNLCAYLGVVAHVLVYEVYQPAIS